MKVKISHGEYTPICRDLLLFFGPEQIEDKLEVEKDLAMKVYVGTGNIPVCGLADESFEVPNFKIRGEFEVSSGDPSLIVRGKERVVDAMRRQEDTEVLKLLNAATPPDHQISVTKCLCYENLVMGMTLLWEHDLDVHAIIMHPMRYKDLLYDGCIDIRKKGIFLGKTYKACWGHVDDVPVLVSTMVPKNAVYITAPPSNLGVFGLFENVQFKVNKQKSQEGKRHYDAECTLGICVVHDWAVSRIIVS